MAINIPPDKREEYTKLREQFDAVSKKINEATKAVMPPFLSQDRAAVKKVTSELKSSGAMAASSQLRKQIKELEKQYPGIGNISSPSRRKTVMR